MRQLTRLFTSTVLFFIALLLFPIATFANEMPNIDLQEQDKEKEFYCKLDGEWLFFPDEFVNPNDISAALAQGENQLVSIPNSFEQHTNQINTFGTYTTTVTIPASYIGETLAIHIPYQYSAYTFFVNDNKIASNGVVGGNAETHEAEMAPELGYFIAESEEITLTMHISSFEHIRGGFENSIYIGKGSVVVKKNNINMILNLFMNGCIFITGLFMFLFSLYRRREQVFLIFGLFAMLISARALFTVPFYYTIIFTNISWLWGTRLEYLFSEATSILFIILLWKWYEKEFSKIVMYILVSVAVIAMVVTLFTQPVYFQTFFFKVFGLAVPAFLYFVYVVIKSIRRKNRITKVNVIGMLLIFLAFLNDFAVGNDWYNSTMLMLPAVGIYVLIHVVSMSRDFATRANQTEQQYKELIVLHKSNEKLTTQLQREIKQKDDFLANTSHELRNPLHSIINLSQAILRERGELSEKTIKDLQLQITIGRHMRQTLGDLLDITRLKEQRIQLHTEPLYVQEVTSGVVDMLKVLVDHKDIRMKIRIPANFPAVTADYNRLIQILFNLLHNAVKYTEAGSIVVHTTIENDMAHIHITDSGMGIDKNTLETIFEPYTQGDSSITATGGGLGLGLSIVRELVELHGGKLSVTSVIGEGSTFTFSLPITDEEVASQKKLLSHPLTDEQGISGQEMALPDFLANHVLPEPSLFADKIRILAVDDDPINLKILKNILPSSHYDIMTVTSGEAALKLLGKQQWNLVISDVMMPNMSGYELTQIIRETHSIMELPILLLTARGNIEDISSGFLSGANDYVIKPVDADELNARVYALTHLQTAVKERLNMEAAWLQAQIRPHFILNTLNAIISLSEIDIERMKVLMGKFVDYLHRSFYLKNIDTLVTLQDEIELLESYLYIEGERFGDRLRVEWQIDDVIDRKHVMIPPLTLQTLVENAVNHGVLKKLEGGTITIRMQQEQERTIFTIHDDGVGMDELTIKDMFEIKEKAGIGMVNTEQRLKQLFGKGLWVESSLGVGTTVSFEVHPVSVEDDE